MISCYQSTSKTIWSEAYANTVCQPSNKAPRKACSLENIHVEPLKESLKRSFSSSESIQSTDAQHEKHLVDCCKGCKKPFTRLFYHLTKSTSCSKLYDMKTLKEELENDKRAKEKLRKQRTRQKKQEEDPKAFREKRSSEKKKERTHQMEQDPEAFKEKEAVGRQKRRVDEMKQDPEAFKEKEAVGRQNRRVDEMKQDPEGFRDKRSSEKKKERTHQMEQDPEAFRD